MFAIKVENLSKIYKKQVENSATGLFSFKNKREDFYALKELNFEIQKGETVGIIGGNGAGKSTLLKILSNITYPSSGRALIDGRVTSMLEVGTGFHPELTGRENVYLNGSLLGMSKKEIQAKFDEIVDFSGIEGFIDSPVKNYSSGMYVRLAFSVAAHLQTEIILLDEVLAVGDAQFQKKCFDIIQNLNKTGKTVLIVSHDIPLILKHAKKGLLLNKGTCVYNGGIIEVCNKYLDREQISEFARPNGKISYGRAEYADKKIKISIKYSFTQKPVFPNLGFIIYTTQFNPITGSNVAFELNSKNLVTNFDKIGSIEATIESINLTNGQYLISLWLADGSIVHEHLASCLDIQVSDSINVINGTGPIVSNVTFKVK